MVREMQLKDDEGLALDVLERIREDGAAHVFVHRQEGG